ncbi:DUF177 domain-containing protein [Fulvivirga sp. M361]|uniref:YceD family protein n=1 Tax=Fulvivirga sp. M361 TaxID=2594266 RepID=UPI00117AF77C|nr:DUF177 domain-containing protein [Fulvivirga sp. M361]TRX61779.1 DUF177 domain-containing protein [Fulvivirga sp. M361]
MNVLQSFDIDIFRLSNKEHNYQFDIGNSFFAAHEGSVIEEGNGKVNMVLAKNDNFIKATFDMALSVKLTCDRSLDPFDFEIRDQEEMIFKFGEEEKELDDNIVIIERDRQRIHFAQYIYEFIGVAIPMKRLHPRFKDENEDDELIYSSQNDQDGKAEDIDPRWKMLKGLKNKE